MTSDYTIIDAQILKLLADNNPKSISLMYEAHHDVILKRLNSLLGDQQDSEDVLQELFLSLWEKRGKLKLAPPLRGYLLTAAHNRALNFMKRKARMKLTSLDTTLSIVQGRLTGSGSPNRRLLESKIKAAIGKLPHRTRIIYLLSRNFDMSNVEIAGQLNISVKAVEKHITKALKLLRGFLQLSLTVMYVVLGE